VIADRLHRVANGGTNERAFQRFVVIDGSAGDRAYDYASGLAVVMTVMPSSGECTACGHHQRKAENGCLNSTGFCGHVSSTSGHK